MTEQLVEAGLLLAVGMTVVFSFLTLLVGGIHAIAWFTRVFPEPENTSRYNKPSYHKNNSKQRSTPTTVNPTIVSAITAAVNEHRRQQAGSK